MRHLITWILIVAFAATHYGQKLPKQWSGSVETHMITAGDQKSEGLYDESKVEELRIYFSNSNYWTLMTQNYATKVDIPCKIKYKNVELDSVGIRFKGQTSYFMNQSEKKSFNLSTDAYKDQKLEGYKTLNLNNAFQDATFMKEVLYYQLIRKHSPAAKANFVRLYINDKDWGIYLNVQQLNKDFLEEWYESNDGINLRADVPLGTVSTGGGGGGAQWGDGTAALNYLGTDTALYKKYYTLKSNDLDVNPWEELVKVCNVLNNSGSNLESEISKVLDIDKVLWHLASEIAFVDDDSYVHKGKMDYYLYMDAETKRWTTYDYDANSVMSTTRATTWTPFYNATKVNYPLLNKVLAVPAFRQRYLAHLRTIIKESFDETKVNSIIDSYDVLIRDFVFVDPKKTTTNAAYTSGVTALKNFIKTRKTYLLENSEIKQESPVLSSVNHAVQGQTWANVYPKDEVTISVNAAHSTGIKEVVLHYNNGFSGVFQTKKMSSTPSGNFEATIPAFEAGTLVRYYIEAIANDVVGTRTYFPSGTEHQFMYYEVDASLATAKTVVINEFMASNTGIIKDEADETEDWIELFNTTANDIDLSGYFLTDNDADLEKWTFPAGSVIKAKDYLIVWADEDQEQGSLHCNFKLAATGGEELVLLDKQKTILDSVRFGQQTANKSAARKPNGTGNFVIGEHTFGKKNEGTSSAVDVENQNLILYPNPAEGFLNIKNPYAQPIAISISNVNGQIMYIGTVAADNILTVDMEVPGTYFVKYGHTVKRVVVIK